MQISLLKQNCMRNANITVAFVLTCIIALSTAIFFKKYEYASIALLAAQGLFLWLSSQKFDGLLDDDDDEERYEILGMAPSILSLLSVLVSLAVGGSCVFGRMTAQHLYHVLMVCTAVVVVFSLAVMFVFFRRKSLEMKRRLS